MTPSLPPRAPVLQALIDVCGPDYARAAGRNDAIAGRLASFVAAPATTRALADTLRLARDRGLAVAARGGGTKIDWGKPPAGVDLIVDTVRLAGVWDHRPEERVVEVGAGTPVRALQAALALRGQRLAVDPRSMGATVGGMLAVNESGPIRQRYGTPADQVRSISYVGLDGEPGGSDGEPGGSDGEDSGSNGEPERPGIGDVAGVLVSARVRLHPLPAARRWVLAAASTPLRVPALVGEALAEDPEVSAVEVDLPAPESARPREQPAGAVAILVEGDRVEAIRRADRLAHAIGEGAAVSEIAPPWWGRYPFEHQDVAVRVVAATGDLPAIAYALSDAAGRPIPVRGSAAAGEVHAALPGALTPERVGEILESLRHVLMARNGRASIVAAPPHIAESVEMAARRGLF